MNEITCSGYRIILLLVGHRHDTLRVLTSLICRHLTLHVEQDIVTGGLQRFPTLITSP